MPLALNRWLQSKATQQWWLPLLLTLLALGLGVINLGNMGLFGDEYNSLLEFVQPGYHPHSLPFFALLRAWGAVGGRSIEWLRLLSAIFAAALVPVLYVCGWWLAHDWRGGFGVGLVAALSAWRVEEGQEIRFYAYFMFTAALFLLALLWVRRTPHPWARALLVFSAILTLTAHLLGGLFVVIGVVFSLPWPRWPKLRGVLLGALCAIALVLAALPSLMPRALMQVGYVAFGTYQGGNNVADGYLGPRGISAGTLLKPGYAAYIYLFGTDLYPLDWVVSIPASLIAVSALALGLWRLRPQTDIFWLCLAWVLVPVFWLFFALDSLAPPGYTPPGAHHLAPVALVIWLAIGLLAAHPRLRFLWLAYLGVSTLTLGYYYWGQWSLNERKDVDITATMRQAQAAGCGAAAQLLVDGRMRAPTVVYLGRTCSTRYAHALLTAPPTLTTTQVGLVYLATTGDTPQVIPQVQAELARQHYTLQQRWAYGLAVVETYRQNAAPLLADGQLALPWSVPPLGFNSLHLPVTSTVLPQTAILGAVIMQPTARPTWAVTLPTPQTFSGLALTSSTFQASSATIGTATAELTDGTMLTLPLTLNTQTADWAAPGCTQCAVAFTWRKLLDKLGRSAYPGAWADFQAKGFTHTWQWPHPAEVRAFHFALDPAQTGEWWVWQVVPLP